MGIDSASGSLTTDVASEGNAHPPTWRFCEEGSKIEIFLQQYKHNYTQEGVNWVIDK